MLNYSTTQKIKCVKREIEFGKKLYPRWIKNNNMTQEKADHEIGCMASVLDTLESLKRLEDARQELFNIEKVVV
jgi:hypothetical protein